MTSPTRFYHVIPQPQFYQDLTWKTALFEGWSWFNFNNLGLAIVANWKHLTSVAKGLKLKFRKFLGLILTFVEVTGEKLVGWGPFCPLSRIGLRQRLGGSKYYTFQIQTSSNSAECVACFRPTKATQMNCLIRKRHHWWTTSLLLVNLNTLI